METKSNFTDNNASSKKVFVALILIIAGFLLLAFNFNWMDRSLKVVLFSWPMIFIVLGLSSFFKKRYFMALIWGLIGMFFLLPRISIAYPGFMMDLGPNFTNNFWPLILIVIGLAILMKLKERGGVAFRNDVSDTTTTSLSPDGRIKKDAIFGGIETIFLDPVFRGGKIDSVFGGVTLDLRRTSLPEGDTYLYIDVVFGGITLFVPGEWIIVSDVDAVFGGVTDKRIMSTNDQSVTTDTVKRLVLKGDVVFGGCELK